MIHHPRAEADQYPFDARYCEYVLQQVDLERVVYEDDDGAGCSIAMYRG